MFKRIWVRDMAKISKIYCNILNTDNICFSLETARSCKRFHIDNVPVRLLVTYYGIGTEWIPSNACDYSAYYDGKKNYKIIIIEIIQIIINHKMSYFFLHFDRIKWQIVSQSRAFISYF